MQELKDILSSHSRDFETKVRQQLRHSLSHKKHGIYSTSSKTTVVFASNEINNFIEKDDTSTNHDDEDEGVKFIMMQINTEYGHVVVDHYYRYNSKYMDYPKIDLNMKIVVGGREIRYDREVIDFLKKTKLKKMASDFARHCFFETLKAYNDS